MLATPLSDSCNYFKQYSNLYFCRLVQARKDLSDYKALEKVSEIVKHNGDKVCVIGTVFQDKKVHDYTKIGELEYLDDYYLEDEYSRIPLNRNDTLLISGSVLAIKGTVIDDILSIEEICYPYNDSMDSSVDIKMDSPWILLASGLELDNVEHSMNVELLYRFLCGQLSEAKHDLLSNLATVALIGNSFTNLNEKSLLDMNLFIGEVSKYHNVLMVPSNSDPSTVSWPNKPISSHLFPKATKGVTFAENPARFTIGDSQIIFSSGDALNNISTILNYKSKVSKVDISKLMIKCRHLAPCCPDTLPCIPTFDSDPLYLENIPNVLFIGNQEKEDIIQVGKCTVVHVPSFKSTGNVLFYNFEQKQYKVMHFGNKTQ